MEVKRSGASSVQVIDEAQGIVRAITSATNVADDVGDIIEPGAYRKTLAKRTPKVVDAHSWERPVGKCLSVVELMPGDGRLPSELKALGAGGLLAEMQFNLETQAGRDAFANVVFFGAEGEWSIGYDCTGPEGKAFQGADGFRHIQELALFEVSPVLFGANPYTGTLSAKQLVAAAQGAPEAERLELARQFKALLAEAEAKAATAYHDVATTEVPWDAGENVNRIKSGDVAALKACFALVNGDETVKGSYKLPHHMVSADGSVGAANLGACSSAIGALNGGRGGMVDVSESEKKAAWAHLAHHLRDGGKTPPELKGAPVEIDGSARGIGSVQLKAPGGHSHVHKHGDVSHEHGHTHLHGNYGHGSGTEVVHAHGHEDNPELDPESNAWPPQTPEAVGMNAEGGPTKARAGVQTKAFVNLEGSYESVQADLEGVVEQWLAQTLPGEAVLSWVEATYPTYCVVGVNSFDPSSVDGGPTEYWQVPYTRSADGVYELGDPKAVDIRGVAIDVASAQPGQAVEFLPSAKVAALEIGVKNATRLRRRLALLANAGEDISAYGIDPAALGVTIGVGGGMIPAAGAPSYLTGQMDTAVEGMGDQQFTNNPPLESDGSSLGNAPGNMTTPPLPAWYQGTYFVDNAGNLQPSPLPAAVLGPLGSSAPALPANTGSWSAGAPVQGVTNTGPTIAQVAQATRDQAGTFDLGKSAQAAKRARVHPQRRVLDRVRRNSSVLFSSAPGAGGPGDPPHTMGPGPSEALVARVPELMAKTAELMVAFKEGRVLNRVNAERVQAAHAALTAILAQAGIDPLDPDDAAPNTTAGDDEEGVPIETDDAGNAPDAGKNTGMKGLDPLLAQWEMVRMSRPA